MPRILFIEHNGAEHSVDAEVGKTVMQAAVENLISGIVGDCGGSCSCATCHCYVDPAWAERLQPASESETMMIEGALHAQDSSRLSCQIVVEPELDGLVVRLPVSQF
jgi:ferredoxin, 2Fe-2S